MTLFFLLDTIEQKNASEEISKDSKTIKSLMANNYYIVSKWRNIIENVSFTTVSKMPLENVIFLSRNIHYAENDKRKNIQFYMLKTKS